MIGRKVDGTIENAGTYLAEFADESGIALAREHVVLVDAELGAGRVARAADAFVDLGLAPYADVSWATDAREAINLVDAGSAVLARIADAVVRVMLAS